MREAAEALNQPLLSAPAARSRRWSSSRCASSSSLAALSGLKAAEDGNGLILRVYEPSGARGAFAFRRRAGWREAGAVDILEEPTTAPTRALTPFALRSWRLVKN